MKEPINRAKLEKPELCGRCQTSITEQLGLRRSKSIEMVGRHRDGLLNNIAEYTYFNVKVVLGKSVTVLRKFNNY